MHDRKRLLTASRSSWSTGACGRRAATSSAPAADVTTKGTWKDLRGGDREMGKENFDFP